jgi:hypothetical protein
VTQQVRNVSQNVQRTAANVSQNVQRTAANVSQNVQRTAANVNTQVRDTFQDARRVATDTAQRTARAIDNAAAPVVRATDRIADGVRRVTPQAVQNAVGRVANAHGTLSNAIDSRLTAGARRAFDVAGRVAGAAGAAADVITGNPKALLTVPTVAVDAAGLAGRTAGKAASRLVPGLNVAAAAVDSYNFVQTMRDPSANTTDKVLSGITAAGSILGATNIPVVSQVGGVVGTIADIANNFFGTQN